MDRQEKLNRIKSMLTQVAPEDSLESIARRPGAEMPEGLESVGEEISFGDTLGKLEESRFDAISDSESFALEAIVLPRERPVVFIQEDRYQEIGEPWTHLSGAEFRSRLEPAFRSIGRVELPGVPWIPYGGTAFVVGPKLLMTNRHVAKLFSEGVGMRIRYRSGDAGIDFRREQGSASNGTILSVRGVEMVHPFWDMALLRVDGLEDHQPLVLSVRSPEELRDREVVAVGYPARDERNDLAVQDEVFKRVYNVKRLQPGKLRQREEIRSFENVVNALTHDSSTLGGNSGSALLDVSSGEVVGLHFAGIYLRANYAVPAFEMARDRRIVSKGIRFSGAIPPTNDWEPAWQRVEESTPAAVSFGMSGGQASSDTAAATVGGTLAGQPGTAAAPPSPPAPPHQMSSVQPGDGAAGWSVWDIPLRVAVSMGTPVSLPPSSAVMAQRREVTAGLAATEAIRMQVPKIYGNLEQRTGFQRDFLDLSGGASVPMPELTCMGRQVAAKLCDGSPELKYHKFSVVMHRGRRLALMTAANVDWREAKRLVNGRKPSRKELTEIPDGFAEQWVTDWRIAENEQLPDIFFSEDGSAFDKGHLVRRDDVCWGSGFADIQKANGDTYHTTNCSPQIAGFNQSAKGVDNWGDLENLVQQQTKAERAVTYAGPIFAEDDQLFKGKTELGTVLVRIPKRFWKVIVVKGSLGAEAYAFILEQDLSQVPVAVEFAVPQNWRRLMVSIADLESEIGHLLDFSSLKPIDQFDSTEGLRMSSALTEGTLASAVAMDADIASAQSEAVSSNFEVTRAIQAYIPLLRAAYDFAHGNANPPIPSGYEIVAPIRVAAEESLESPMSLTPEAREAIANDFRAMAQEEQPATGLEGIADPQAFGFVFREKQTGAIIVSIRGTQTPAEWMKNFTAVPNPFTLVPGFGFVHLGFEIMWTRIRTSVVNALQGLPNETRITVLGHSLGGAMATLGAVDIKKNLNRPNVDLCTVGGPRAGGIRFRVNFNKLIDRCFRLTEGRDVVPHVPPVFLAWNHVGLEIPVKSKVDNAHSLDSYLEGLRGIQQSTESFGITFGSDLPGFRTL